MKSTTTTTEYLDEIDCNAAGPYFSLFRPEVMGAHTLLRLMPRASCDIANTSVSAGRRSLRLAIAILAESLDRRRELITIASPRRATRPQSATLLIEAKGGNERQTPILSNKNVLILAEVSSNRLHIHMYMFSRDSSHTRPRLV